MYWGKNVNVIVQLWVKLYTCRSPNVNFVSQFVYTWYTTSSVVNTIE